MTIIYDGTYFGLLSSVFEAFRLRLQDKAVIVSQERYQPGLFGEPLRVSTQEAHARRVIAGLKNRDPRATKLAYRCFQSEHERREELILHLVRRLTAEGGSVYQDLTDDRFVLLNRIDKQMGREIHRLHAFVRFQETPDGLFAAVMEPDFDVLPLAVDHFIERYPAMNWLIYDGRRQYGLLWDQHTLEQVTFHSDDHRRLKLLSSHLRSEGEQDFQAYWKTYFASVDIPERRNMKLHLQHVPKRYWRYLVEK